MHNSATGKSSTTLLDDSPRRLSSTTLLYDSPRRLSSTTLLHDSPPRRFSTTLKDDSHVRSYPGSHRRLGAVAEGRPRGGGARPRHQGEDHRAIRDSTLCAALRRRGPVLLG